MGGMGMEKMAAVFCAVLLCASSLVSAGVLYGSTQLVGQDGSAAVKIYVGSKAAASDGVAAASIASAIANEAYKSSMAAASKIGAASCVAGLGVAGAGTCQIDPDSKKVTFTVEAPGAVAGVHTFQTLITDSIDRTLANRNSTRPEDRYSATMAASDTYGSTASPIRAVETNTSKGMLLYMIGSYEFDGFADFATVDGQAPSAAYTAAQSFWVGSSAPSSFGAGGVTYDSSAAIRDIVVNKYSAMAYSLKFTGNDFGIPVCTGDLGTNSSDNWASCDAALSSSRTDKHRLGIKFLGGDWIISEITNPSLALASSTGVLNGGQIKLAKEAQYGIINVGEALDAGAFKVRLSDISVATGSGNSHPAIIDILDASGAVVGQMQVDAGSTYSFNSGGQSVKIHVYKTAPGFTLNAKWAEMAVYTDEITLKDGQRYNLVSSTDADKDYKVSLLWKNRDYTGAPGGNDTTADSLREIVVYNLDGFSDKTPPGGVSFFPAKAPVFKLTYYGVDLASDDTNYIQLTYGALSSDAYRVASSPGDIACGATSSADNTYTAKLVSIKTGGEPVLGGTGDALSGDYRLDAVYLDPIGLASAPAGDLNLTVSSMNQSGLALPPYMQFSSLLAFTVASTNLTGAITLTPTAYNEYNLNTSGGDSSGWYVIPAAKLRNFTAAINGSQDQSANIAFWAPTVFYKIPGRDCYNYDVLAYDSMADVTNAIKFDASGEDSIAQSEIYFSTTDIESTLASAQANIVLVEDAGYYGTDNDNAVLVAVPMIANDTSLQTIRFRPADSASEQVYYLPLGGTGYQPYEPALVTERGSKVESVGTADASIKVARWFGMPTFEFAFADASSANASADNHVMGVGESKVFGGVTLAVASINATAGSCSATCPGLSGCNSSGGSASAAPAGINSPSGISQLPSKMVWLDSDGLSSGVSIIVGGPAVNTLAASALLGSGVDFGVDSILVKDMGNGTLVVAGRTADDTLAAADKFIAGIRGQ